MVAKIIEFLKIVWIVMCALLFCGHPVVRRSNRFWSYYRVANNRAYIPKCIVQFWSWNKLLSVIMSSSSNPSFNCSCVGPGQVRVFRMKENSIRQNLTSSFQLIIKRLLSLKNHPSGKWQNPLWDLSWGWRSIFKETVWSRHSEILDDWSISRKRIAEDTQSIKVSWWIE